MWQKPLLYLFLASAFLFASCNSSEPKIDQKTLSDRERDGLAGNVKAVLTDDVILMDQNGQWFEAQQASSTAIYDSNGKRTLQTPFRVNLNGGFAITQHELLFDPVISGKLITIDDAGKKFVEYDNKGNVVEKGSIENGKKTAIELKVEYEFDSRGNWIKRTISRLTEQNGQKVLLPAEACHRQIIYADAVKSDNRNQVEQTLVKSILAATEENLAAGHSLFLQKCSACHGTDGKSQTEFAAVMPTRPADLTGPKIAKLTESQIYSLVSAGIAQSGMPAFKNRISDESIWKLALYLRQFSQAKQVHLLTAQTTPPPTKEAALPNAERRYALTGKIVSVERELKQITIEHEEIKGYMEAMTMPFPLADEKLLGKAKKGDKIQATLVIGGSGGWRLENVIIR